MTPSPSRPVPQPRLRPHDVALGAVGGAVGTALRAGLVLAAPPQGVDDVDVAVLAINVAGAFALGLLLERLALRGPDRGRQRAGRLLVGTGVLGGFTTYSTLALDTAHLLQEGRAGMALAYALGTVLLGAGAALAGIRCGARAHGRRGA